MSEPSLLQIFVFRDGAYVGNEVYTDAEIVIGTADGVDLHLDDDLVSPRHAVIKQENDGQIRLTRAGALPLRVNRKDVNTVVITSRDEIQIGEHTLKIKTLEKRAQPGTKSTRPSVAVPEIRMSAGLAEDLGTTEAMTEVVTASIEISGSDVVAARNVSNSALPARSRAPAPRKSSSQVDGVWDESAPSGDDHLSIENALDSAFSFGEKKNGATISPDFQGNIDQTLPRADRKSLQAKPAAARAPAPAPAPAARVDPRKPSYEQSPPPDRTAEVRPAAQPQKKPYDRSKTPSISTTEPEEPIAVVADEDDLDEDEIDAWTRPGFSLLRTVVQQSAAAPMPTKDAAIEILAFSGDAVRQAAILVERHERYVLGELNRGAMAPPAGYPGLRLAKLTASGAGEIEFPSSAEGVVIEAGSRIQLEDLMKRENAVSKTGDVFRYALREGSSATMKVGDTTFHVRFVRPPRLIDPPPAPFDWSVAKAIGFAVVAHMLALIFVALLRPSVVYSDAPHEVWSDPQKNEVREVEIKEPPPPEPVAEVKEPEPEPEPPPPEPEPKKSKREPREAGGGKIAKEPKGVPKTEIKSAGVLGAMGKLNLAAPGKKSIVQAVSNIDAVRAPGGLNFRVGALVGKLPASEVSVGGGGGGGLLTRGGASLLRGGDGLAQLGKRGGGKVRGQVTKVTARNVEAKGSISREEVAAVINQHLREVQYCYEKTLLKDPGLSGKLVLEWVINTDGGVGRVKEKLSTLRNPEVSGCISSSLKRWTFPKPRGGIVIVSYPFIFNAVGF